MTLREKAVLAAEILVAYVRARRRMRRGEIRSMVDAARRVERRRRPVAAGPWEGLHLGRAVVRTLTPLPTDSRCLVRSLVLVELLAAREVPSTLVIGAKPQPRFMAHAWVEVDGHAVLPVEGFDAERLVEL